MNLLKENSNDVVIQKVVVGNFDEFDVFSEVLMVNLKMNENEWLLRKVPPYTKVFKFLHLLRLRGKSKS